MPSPPTPNHLRDHSLKLAKQRVRHVHSNGGDWRLAAVHNDLSYSVARRAIIQGETPPRLRGGVCSSSVKMTVEIMAKLEEYLDEDCHFTLTAMKTVRSQGLTRNTLHHKKLRIEKTTTNNTTNKNKRKEFVEKLEEHVAKGDMIIYQDETNFNLYLSRSEEWHASGKTLHIQGCVSTLTGVVLLRTHEGSITKEESARFIADLFVAAQRTEEYQGLPATNKVVIVTDNAPAHSSVETLACELLVSAGIMNNHILVLLRLWPYSPILNPIEGCWNVLKA
ncbi:Transposase [Phytophthora megakarya]|uniref:Transposase n=1 Tax=Phytophthora megakarya TaxID=4795 RepID=A0A225V9M0_9STRA|nr:Transposase [Phytophthora megakarya]